MGADLVPIEPADQWVPALPGRALDRLPAAVGLDADPYWRLAAAFLVGYQGHSRSGYFADLKAWHAWCTERGVHPLAVERHHVDTWVSYLTEAPQPRTGRPASPATIARRLSCLSKFYEYAVRDVELLDASPLVRVRRPKVDDDSATVGLGRGELDQLLTAAEADGPRSAALVGLLVYNGLRISEALSRDVEHFTHQTGHRVLRLTRKGGKRTTEARPKLLPASPCTRSRPTSASAPSGLSSWAGTVRAGSLVPGGGASSGAWLATPASLPLSG